MLPKELLILSLIFGFTLLDSSNGVLSGDPRLCLGEGDSMLRRFEVLPGRGWDNLRNEESGLLVDFNYSQCKTTDDGRYIIPDNVDTIPLKRSFLESFAEMFDHWSNYTSMTSRSINVDTGLSIGKFGLSGKYSSEFESVKKHQVEEKSITTRVQLRYSMYSVKLQANPTLKKAFRERLHSIAAHLTMGRTENVRYESQMLVRDYGTHIITSAEAGALLSQEDQIKSTFINDYNMEKSQVTASASASFLPVAHINISHHKMASKEMIDQYIGNRTHSVVRTFGGPVFQISNYSASEWEKSMHRDLVAVDIKGDPIFFIITPTMLPELPPSTVYQLMRAVKSEVELYYKFNTHRGCTSMDSPNFSYQANVDDDTCQAPSTNFTFAGVYQTCTMTVNKAGDLCAGIEQKNPLTGNFSCPNGYESVLLNEGEISKNDTHHSCHRCWVFKKCCKNQHVKSEATYRAYWCYAKEPPSQQSGFLFGGLYTTTVSNPLTQAHVCPKFFYPLHLNTDLSVCVSDDYELGFKYSVPFAGFYSCSAGNPLTLRNNNREQPRKLMMYLIEESSEVWPKTCPPGYSQHLAAVDHGCEIEYCVESKAFSDKGLPPIRRPPFMPTPSSGYIAKAPVEIGPLGLEWSYSMIDQGSEFTLFDGSATVTGRDSLSKEALVGITVAATLVCIIAACAIIWGVRRNRVKRASRKQTASTHEGAGINNPVEITVEQ